ncbi:MULTISPECIES: hypothetical protein [unclassified Rhizobium]|uniref:hypothetical protein n=1 Tax=unclassified Rhizobium TaxID=2613769 RepID=UPI001ADA561F|nr:MULTISPECIES: hypothetical protein [unclassified Rhizobium]MBO9102438.1 hypothetical protein [Rhizobium sp. L58/93]MBO9172320.1 hypothetical protein [Rhizobium sp. L245/93]MBO9188079.1 hypothetical protein [Rhizobium sp. E27B/91]QXZ86188.1 hypothetical protein J5287_24225 [Rhizobium sp. K1/93]QXZ92356.1 hypothetical protein J5280_24965 [Rhizobium sp. K15/93]
MQIERPISAPVLLLGFSLALLHMPSGIPAPFYPLYEARFAIGSMTISMFFATYILGVVLALLLAPKLTFFRYILVFSCLLSVLGDLVFLRAGSVFEIYMGHLIHGLVLGVFTLVIPVVLGRIDFSGSSKIAGRITTSANAIGLTAGPLWSGLMLAYVPSGDSLIWWLQIGMTVLVTPFMRLNLSRGDQIASKLNASLKYRWRIFFEDRLTIAAVIVGFASFASGGLLAALGSVLASSVMLESNSAIQGFAVSIGFAMSAIAGGLHLRRSDASTIFVGVVFIALGVVGLAIAITWAHLPVFLLSAGICGVGQGLGLQGATQAVAHRSSADQASKSISSFFLICYSGTVCASFGVGLIIAASDLETASVLFCAFLLLVCIVGIAIIPKNKAATFGR